MFENSGLDRDFMSAIKGINRSLEALVEISTRQMKMAEIDYLTKRSSTDIGNGAIWDRIDRIGKELWPELYKK